jgi:hypothetical protein
VNSGRIRVQTSTQTQRRRTPPPPPSPFSRPLRFPSGPYATPEVVFGGAAASENFRSSESRPLGEMVIKQGETVLLNINSRTEDRNNAAVSIKNGRITTITDSKNTNVILGLKNEQKDYKLPAGSSMTLNAGDAVVIENDAGMRKIYTINRVERSGQLTLTELPTQHNAILRRPESRRSTITPEQLTDDAVMKDIQASLNALPETNERQRKSKERRLAAFDRLMAAIYDDGTKLLTGEATTTQLLNDLREINMTEDQRRNLIRVLGGYTAAATVPNAAHQQIVTRIFQRRIAARNEQLRLAAEDIRAKNEDLNRRIGGI